jgi:hypothetical protein
MDQNDTLVQIQILKYQKSRTEDPDDDAVIQVCGVNDQNSKVGEVCK